MKRITVLQHRFNVCNRRYFRNRLKNVTVKWESAMNPDHLGATYSSSAKQEKGTRKFLIEINSEIRRYPSIVTMTLLHEMVHVEQWDKTTHEKCHGYKFERRMKQLAARGAFTGLW